MKILLFFLNILKWVVLRVIDVIDFLGSIFSKRFWMSDKDYHLGRIDIDDKITIRCPIGYTTEVGGQIMTNYPTSVTVVNNDPKGKKIFIKLPLKDNKSVLIILPYTATELEDYILMNIAKKKEPTKPVPPKKEPTKEDLERELQDAIDNSHFELAKVINDKLLKMPR